MYQWPIVFYLLARLWLFFSTKNYKLAHSYLSMRWFGLKSNIIILMSHSVFFRWRTQSTNPSVEMERWYRTTHHTGKKKSSISFIKFLSRWWRVIWQRSPLTQYCTKLSLMSPKGQQHHYLLKIEAAEKICHLNIFSS